MEAKKTEDGKHVNYYKLLLPFLRKDKGLLLFGLFAMLVTSSLRLLDPLILAHIIDKSIPNRDLSEMYRYGVFFVMVVILSGLLSYLQIVLLSKLGIRIITRFKSQVFEHLLKLPVPWFNEQPVGELIARVESDSERVKVLFSDLSIMIIGNLLFFFGVFVVLFMREQRITLFIIPPVIIVIIAYRYLIRFLSKYYKMIRERYAEITAKITDFVQGMQLIQTLNQEYRIIAELEQSSLSKKDLETKTSFLEYGSQGVFMFIFNVLLIVVIILLSAPKILSGLISLGTLIVFIQYMYRMIWPLMHISENVMQIQRSFVSLKRILELTELPTEDQMFSGHKMATFHSEIRFENVWFAYTNEEWILKGVSFQIPKGSQIALVGASGSGKTTAISLLCGFFPIQKGRILIDGVDLKEIDFRSWRAKIGLILQDIFLFPGSILENVRVYNNDIGTEDVENAIQMVHLDDFIRQQDLGLDTELAERGQNISQGEKQLISFARALAFYPELIVMDEATASIDPQTEAKIQRSMQQVLSGKTAVIVAHRLSSILDSDQIILFKDGEIADRGTHTELLRSSADYRKLVELQVLVNTDED